MIDIRLIKIASIRWMRSMGCCIFGQSPTGPFMKWVQGVLSFKSRGGARRGAGRKRTAELPQVPHRVRARHIGRHPVHVTLRTRCRSLRSQFVFPTVRRTIAAVNHRSPDEFRVVEFSIQSNHVHLLVEAASSESLSSGMRSFNIRLARSVNRLLFQRGSFFADRWHGRALSSPRAVRNALVYVLANHKKHAPSTAQARDPFSSGPYFPHFLEMHEASAQLHERGRPNQRPRTWLLAEGWQLHGLLSVHERPSGK